jgi:purine-binding chemotaxis protein CheW
MPLTQMETPANAADAEAADLQRIMLVRVGEHHFGLPVAAVREIIPARSFTPLPGTADYVCGMINLRGRIVTVLDLAARLGLPASSLEPEHSIVVLDYEGKLVGVTVSDVVRITMVDRRELDESAESLRALHLDRAYVTGVGEIEEGVFVAIDPDGLLQPILL